MDWRELEREVAAGRIAPVYLLYGDEGYLREQALQKIKARLLPPEAGDFDYQEMEGRELTAAAIVLLADTLPALAERRLVVVKNPVPELFKDAGGALTAYLADPAATTCLVLAVDGSIDKRLKLVKLMQQSGRVVEFPPLKTPEQEKWLQQEARAQGYNLSPPAARALAAAASSLRQARNELYKVMTYLGQPGTITATHVATLVANVAAEATIFQLVDALGSRNATRAIAILRRLLEKGEAPLSIAAMLARQLRLIYRYHLVPDRRQLASWLGVKPFVVQKVAAQAGNFSLAAAGRALEELLKVDTGLKTGQGSPEALLEKALWNIAATAGQKMQVASPADDGFFT